MGLAEYIKQGVVLARESIQVQTNAVGSGSVELGSAYMLFSIQTDVPCRLRLYDNQSSLINVGERDRKFGNTNVSESVALIGDISMSSVGTHTIDPVLYSVIETPQSKATYYRVEGVSSAPYPKISFNRYLMENSSINTSARKTLPVIQHTFTGNEIVSGTISNISIPQTYLLVSASITGSYSTDVARLRLYSTKNALNSTTEISRSFSKEPTVNSYLIVDAIMSASQVTYFVPKIVGVNLENMGTDLTSTALSREKISGNNEIYYVLQKMSTSPTNITASIHVFSLED